ncbi:MAG: hypothetical protein IJ873_07410, partial [Lachnospiraceae bacterium]|nr:hypothetical protein [Lachnospiraceae bacterium]
EGALPAVLTLMTYEKPFIIENNIEKRKDRLNNNNAIHQRNFGNTSQSNRDSEKLIIAIGDLGRIEAEGIEEISIETCPIKDERLKLAWKHDCYRILLKMKKDSAVIRIC